MNDRGGIFAFDAKLTANVDVISDFVSGNDDINLSKSIFNFYKKVGVDLTNDFVSGANATAQDLTDHFLYDTVSGTLSYDKDGSGTKFLAVQFATLTGVPTLLASDLHIV